MKSCASWLAKVCSEEGVDEESPLLLEEVVPELVVVLLELSELLVDPAAVVVLDVSVVPPVPLAV